MSVLVVNAGSSSLKLSALDPEEHLVAARTIEVDGDDATAITDAIADFTRAVGPLVAVGHRVVHGGTQFTQPVVIDDDVEESLRALVPLAPLHQPQALDAIAAARRVVAGVRQVACFDTAFHSTLPAAAYVYALPAAWRDRWPLRRFGFHGLSHAYASRRAAELAGAALGDFRVVSCHLGAGASACAVERGASVDTTMGFTPLEGLVMATRAGSVDPGLVLWLMTTGGLSAGEVQAGLEHDSGLAGLTGHADMRDVLAQRAAGDARSVLGFNVYAHRLRREIGAMTAALESVDAVVFTGGVGEHAPEVRGACGLELDPAENARTEADGEISAAGAAVRTFVVTAREDIEVTRGVRSCLG